jgi:hypothetical protein
MVIVPEHPSPGRSEGRITDYSWSGLGVSGFGVESALTVTVGAAICVNVDGMLIAGVVRNYRRCDDGTVHAGIEVTDAMSAVDPNPSVRSFMEKFRHRFAEFILGRPIDITPAFRPGVR